MSRDSKFDLRREVETRKERTLSKLGRFLYNNLSHQQCSFKQARGLWFNIGAKASHGFLTASNRGARKRKHFKDDEPLH